MAAPLLKNDTLEASSLPTLIGILAESPSEKRVSMVPDVAAQLVKDGYKVNVEKGAGVKSSFTDMAYSSVGCKILSHDEVLKQSTVFFRIDAPVDDFNALGGKVVISWVGRLLDAGKKVIEQAVMANVTLLDVTAVPRITIAQKLDVLSSQAKCAGHRAVLEAAHAFGRFHTSEMTAAGKFPPSHTFILGCGVAGLAAIGTSRAMGSIVRAWDVRDVHDQVESMGGKWVKVDFKEDACAAGGYAKESSQEFMKAQRETFHKHAKEVDIIITTAAIPGRPSPTLITDDMVKDMKAGSVIVDLAALGGGNCTMTKKDEIYTTENGVTIIGYCDLPGRLAPQASAMYATNMLQLLRHVHGKEGATAFTSNLFKQLDMGEDGDIVSRSIVTCKDKKALIMPKPPMIGAPAKKKEPAPVKEKPKENPQKDAMILAIVVTIGIALILLSTGVQVTLVRSFLLAGAAGYQAVWGVAHALHTPLMSVTNAISGLTAIGGIMLMDRVMMESNSASGKVLALLSAMVSAVNIIGGFVVSQRMLNLFKRPGDVDFSYYMLAPGLLLMVWPWIQDFKNGSLAPLSQENSEFANTVSALLCITSIVALSSMKSANLGCKYGMMGAAGAIAVALRQVAFSPHAGANLVWVIGVPALMAIGGFLGLYIGGTVSPIALPQTVAAFHSLVGLAAMLTSIGSFYEKQKSGVSLINVTAMLGNFIGGITLTGSIVAFGKLNGNLSSKPLNLPGKNWINISMLTAFIILMVCFLQAGGSSLGEALPFLNGSIVSEVSFGVVLLWLAAVLAGIMGWHLVGSVGGGDMPVCVTVLNSYSGWALAAEGFNLTIPLLAVVGSIIGFSGAILTKIMCDAMNRDIFNVIFGGMNTAPPAKKGEVEKKVHVETTVTSTAELIASAKEVVVVPGYGMAVARAQNAIGEVAKLCRENGINCRFAIHPVAGRMPGQMNVLLAEAGVPYDWVQEMDEVNPDIEKVDVVLVMGANDITNSAAQEIEGCPIYGMPVIEVWRAKKTIFCKRSMGGGYADLENPVFFKENTQMLLGDAKKTASELAAALKTALDASV
mmetsp:Transcript_132811/g.234983  ORF Transcript_132811/g.234983 Transcript_132811/m.234983 type:complete len:1062 (-) Transcript_132811:207-3392(-)